MLRVYASDRLFGGGFGTEQPWVLALHGWGRSHEDFNRVLGEDGPSRPALDAVALDLPGFGATPPPPTAWGSPEYAACIAEVLDEMAPKIVVLGHSFGGRVALHLAAAQPDRVAALVLTGVPLLRSGGAQVRPALSYRVTRRLARAGLVNEARLERARQRHGSSDYRSATPAMRGVLVNTLAEQYEMVLEAVTCPTVLVWGEHDDTVPLEVARQALGLLGTGELVVLPGVGHLTPTEAPDALRAAVLARRP